MNRTIEDIQSFSFTPVRNQYFRIKKAAFVYAKTALF
jgi:hypothetical protein